MKCILKGFRWLLALGALATLLLPACQLEHTTTTERTGAATHSPAASAQTATPTSMPVIGMTAGEEEIVMDGEDYACNRGHSWELASFQGHFIQWAPDDSQLIFDFAEAVWVVDVEGHELRKLVDPLPEVDHDLKDQFEESEDLVLASRYGFHADISPDGSRVAYSTCEYESKFKMKVGDPVHPAYEIATINIDGGDQRRETESPVLDHFPVWAPDGKSFVQVLSADEVFSRKSGQLLLRYVDGSKRIVWLTRPMGVALYPPVWSPDGKYIAFAAYGESSRRAIYTIETSGAGLTRIGETTTLPTWSPDGQVLAYASSVETGGDHKEVKILLASPDGTQLREVWSNGPDDPPGEVESISWSPDGSELLVVSDHLWVVRPDGSDNRHILPRTWYFLPDAAVWSSDGSRIALYGWDYARSLGSFKVITLDRDGKDLRVLVALDAERGLYARQHYGPEKEVDVTACSGGSVIPDPEVHSGLVEDCEVLLRSRDRLSGTGSLNWGPTTPISQWQGVEVEGSPSRVRSLKLVNKGLSG